LVGNRPDDDKEYDSKQGQDMDYKYECGDSLRETQDRMVTAINSIIGNHRGKIIIVSSHGTAISTLFRYFDPDYRFEDRGKMKTPDMWKLVFEDEKLYSLEHINLEQGMK